MSKINLSLELDTIQELKIYSNTYDMYTAIEHVLYQIRNYEKYGEDTHASAENLIAAIKRDLSEVMYGLD